MLTEYRRQLLQLEDSAFDPYPEFTEDGISESGGTTLLGDDEPSSKIRRSCLEWCTEHTIEFIEPCASNADFDKCLYVYDDIQGVERLWCSFCSYVAWNDIKIW